MHNHDLIISNGENHVTEFKLSFGNEAIETLVAFANASGGSVYVGVADDGSLKGVKLSKETTSEWINEIKNKTAPVIMPDVDVVELNSKSVVVLKIQEYPIKPVSFRGRYVKRNSNSNHILSVSEVANMHLQSLNSSWDAYPDLLHSLDDITLEKVQHCIDIMKARGLTIAESPLSFLIKNDLIREEKLTNAAYLMFKKNNSMATTIELGRFQDYITIKDTSRTQSDIITQVDQVLDFVKKHINLALIITGEAQNTQKWQYPLEAIREIVLNMIIHRDYRSSSDSVVKILNDSIEFYNPGRLPDGLTIQDLLDNNYKSTPRNKSIAEFFKNLGWIEKYGSGIGRIINYFKEENLPLPEFKIQGEGFLVKVYATNNTEILQNVTKNVTKNVTENVTEKRSKIILETIMKNKGITTEELAKKLNVTKRTILRDIEKLKHNGILKYVGSTKGGHWEIGIDDKS